MQFIFYPNTNYIIVIYQLVRLQFEAFSHRVHFFYKFSLSFNINWFNDIK